MFKNMYLVIADPYLDFCSVWPTSFLQFLPKRNQTKTSATREPPNLAAGIAGKTDERQTETNCHTLVKWCLHDDCISIACALHYRGCCIVNATHTKLQRIILVHPSPSCLRGKHIMKSNPQSVIVLHHLAHACALIRRCKGPGPRKSLDLLTL